LPLLLQYDSTAEESDMTESHGVGASVQIAKNLHAVQASQALSRLSGLCSDENSTPYNQGAADALRALLTPKLSSMLKDQVPKDLLSRLNTNLESPEVNPMSFLFSCLPEHNLCVKISRNEDQILWDDLEYAYMLWKCVSCLILICLGGL
jgi:hypothetical protein